jgi:hypothetical protein
MELQYNYSSFYHPNANSTKAEFLWISDTRNTDAIACRRPSLWSSGQSFWLQIQRPGFDSWRYQIFGEVVNLKRGPLSLVSTSDDLLERESSSSGLESREYGLRDPLRWQCGTFFPQKLVLTSPTNGGRSVGIVRSRTQARKFSF